MNLDLLEEAVHKLSLVSLEMRQRAGTDVGFFSTSFYELIDPF